MCQRSRVLPGLHRQVVCGKNAQHQLHAGGLSPIQFGASRQDMSLQRGQPENHLSGLSRLRTVSARPENRRRRPTGFIIFSSTLTLARCCSGGHWDRGYLAPSGGGTGTGAWKTDSQHCRRSQEVHLSVPAAVRGITEGECGLISKHVHSQLARCNPLFHFLNFNILVPTGFVLVGHK